MTAEIPCPLSAEQVADGMLHAINNALDTFCVTADERARIKFLVRRGLAHPEQGPRSTTLGILSEEEIHPRSTGNSFANRQGPVCVCGASRRRHDIDGLRPDCDGYVEAK